MNCVGGLHVHAHDAACLVFTRFTLIVAMCHPDHYSQRTHQFSTACLNFLFHVVYKRTHACMHVVI